MPRCGEVYNLGGGRGNSCSILEAFERIGAFSGRKMVYEYVDENREGDHLCYISDLRKIHAHYPRWGIAKTLNDIFEEIYRAWRQRLSALPSPHLRSVKQGRQRQPISG
jgi:CDP-paratose 2-epimerase